MAATTTRRTARQKRSVGYSSVPCSIRKVYRKSGVKQELIQLFDVLRDVFDEEDEAARVLAQLHARQMGEWPAVPNAVVEFEKYRARVRSRRRRRAPFLSAGNAARCRSTPCARSMISPRGGAEAAASRSAIPKPSMARVRQYDESGNVVLTGEDLIRGRSGSGAPLPPDASDAACAERYRLAQAHALLHLYEAGRLPIELMRTMDEILKQQQQRD